MIAQLPPVSQLSELTSKLSVFVLDGRLYSADDDDLLIESDPKYDPRMRLPFAWVRVSCDVAVQEKTTSREVVTHLKPADYSSWPRVSKRARWEDAVEATSDFTSGIVNDKLVAGWHEGELEHGLIPTRVITFANDYPDLVVRKSDKIIRYGPHKVVIGDWVAVL